MYVWAAARASRMAQRSPGLGEVSGGIHGDNRLGGNATASCTVYGRIAGLNAAKEKPLA